MNTEQNIDLPLIFKVISLVPDKRMQKAALIKDGL